MTEKEKLNFHIIPSNATTAPVDKEEKVNGKEYISYGEDNMYPLFLSNLYENSSTLAACIDSISDYVFAQGVEDKTLGEKEVNRKGESFNDVLHNCAIDYIAQGAFALQMIGNAYGDILELYYVDVRKVRLSEDGKYIWFNKKNWTKWNKDSVRYDRFTGTKTKNCMFYFKRPQSKTVYGRPLWHSALKSVMTDVEIANFHYSSIMNNFAPSAIVNFNSGVPSEEVQDKIENKLTEKFTGTDNAARMLLSFNDDETHRTTIERFQEDNFDKKYDALSQSVMNKILASFRVSSALVGIMPEQTGFNSVEYKSAFALYKATVVRPIQQEIESAFNKIGIEMKLTEFIVDFGEEEGGEI